MSRRFRRALRYLPDFSTHAVVALLGAFVLMTAPANAETGSVVFQPELGVPGTGVVAIGGSPGEAPGEAWAYGSVEGRTALLEHVQGAGWQVLPLPPAPEGGTLAPTSQLSAALAAQATPAGGVVLVTSSGIVTRDPGGQPRLIPAPLAAVGVIDSGANATYAAIDEPREAGGEGRTGVLDAALCPPAAGSSSGGSSGGSTSASGGPSSMPCVLHYDGHAWTQEPIELPAELQREFTPESLACGPTPADPSASSPKGCWLLAQYTAPQPSHDGRLALFRRVPTAEPAGFAWVRQPVADQLLGVSSQTAGAISALGSGAQMLTVTAQGVWVDFQAQLGAATTPSQVSELIAAPALEGAYSTSTTLAAASPVGTWCYPFSATAAPPGCSGSLGAALPSSYRSFAWAGASATDPGTRVITGLSGRSLLRLSGGSFSLVSGPGDWGPENAPGAAAFNSPSQGWIADGAEPGFGYDHAGQAAVIEVAEHAGGEELAEEPVPFRKPLLAVAQEPGSTPGSPSGQAIAVGLEGQIAHYVPGEGWRPEALYNAAGEAQPANLRGVAWPESGRAYAVGDNGTMWLWRAETGLWEPDPAKPFNLIGNLTAIAFSPSDPSLGYAVGKQGIILRYGKSWEQVELPPELQRANFTSVAFAGNEVLATYHMAEGEHESGGLAVQEGEGPWHVETAVSPGPLFKVAGLPAGAAVVAGPGRILERDSLASPWHPSSEPLPEMQNVAALAAYQEPSGQVRAIISIDMDEYISPNHFGATLFRQGPWAIDMPPPGTGAGQPPLFLEPDPLPLTGYLLKETAGGWVDMEHGAVPNTPGRPSDAPYHPDPVLALEVAPTGASGLAVGGQTGDFENGHPDTPYETSGAMRFPAGDASSDGASPAPIMTGPGNASFVVAGQATCFTGICEGPLGEHFGPVAWLEHALQSSAEIKTGSTGKLSAFLYTGSIGGVDVFPTVRARTGGGLPMYAVGACEGQKPFCSYLTEASSGEPQVRVIVLGYSAPGPALTTAEEEALSQQLAAATAARTPAIVIGRASLGLSLPEQSASGGGVLQRGPRTSGEQVVEQATDAATVASLLRNGGAVAYFFDYPGSNVQGEVDGVKLYGSGALGYVGLGPLVEGSAYHADSLGSSGYLLAEVSPCKAAPGPCGSEIAVRVEPNISQLALDATSGVLIRRSHVALFQALARRPPGGVAVDEVTSGVQSLGPELYDQIPFDCQGPNCPYEVPTAYAFASSNPDRGAFVVHEPGSENPRQVELGPDKLPVIDEPRNSRGELTLNGQFERNSRGEPINEKGEVVPADQSGIFCAFNAGATTVSITTGGLTYSEPITIQAGSVEYPCGTVPLKNPPAAESAQLTGFPSVPLATSNPPQANPQVQTLAPPPPPPAAPIVPSPHPPRVHAAAPPPFLPLLAAPVAALPAIVPPPGPPVPRPIPPSGTSQVYQSAVAPKEEQEKEEATSLVGLHEFSAYRADEHSGPGPWLLLLVLVAAGAGTGIRRGGLRPSRRRLALARASARRR